LQENEVAFSVGRCLLGTASNSLRLKKGRKLQEGNKLCLSRLMGIFSTQARFGVIGWEVLMLQFNWNLSMTTCALTARRFFVSLLSLPSSLFVLFPLYFLFSIFYFLFFYFSLF